MRRAWNPVAVVVARAGLALGFFIATLVLARPGRAVAAPDLSIRGAGVTAGVVPGQGDTGATGPSDAEAAGGGRQRLAVLHIDFDGEIPEGARDLMNQRLVEGLAVARFQVVAGAAAGGGLKESGIDPASCSDAACYTKAAETLDVRYLVVGSVAVRQKNYDITLELIDGHSGDSLGQRRERCELCGLEEAGEKMGLAASPLRERLEALIKGPARFVIRSTPAGARLEIDGKPAGRTPVDTELPAGPHSLLLRAPGFEPHERSFTAVAGVEAAMDLSLEPEAGRFPSKEAGWIAVGVGAAALVGGVWAVAVDGNEIDCTDSRRDPRGHCPFVRNTRGWGAALAGVGGALVAGGGVALYIAGSAPVAEDPAAIGDDADGGGGEARAPGRGFSVVATGRF